MISYLFFYRDSVNQNQYHHDHHKNVNSLLTFYTMQYLKYNIFYFSRETTSDVWET